MTYLLVLTLATIIPPEMEGPVLDKTQEHGIYWVSQGRWKGGESYSLYRGYSKIGFLLENGTYWSVHWDYELQRDIASDKPETPPIPRPRKR